MFSLTDALTTAQATYTARRPQSQTHYTEALRCMPGGNTRSVLFNAPYPVFMQRGSGNRLWDYDGNAYIDLVCELSAGLYGHSHPRLRQALVDTYDTVGVNLGATTLQEVQYAALLCRRFPTIEQLRFCNSGTEANIYALSVARRVTGHKKIICFGGAYHGGVLGFGHGIGANVIDRDDWVLAPYNDAAAATALIESTPGVAAVIVEAMQGAGGCIPATVEFLQAIEAAAKKAGILFILDEVMTSRLHANGLAGKYGLHPDLTTLGKYLGGGLAFGAFGGRQDLMAVYDPRSSTSLPHSGTFNNNTLAMACGYAGLAEVYTPTVATEHNALGDDFRAQLQVVAAGTKMVVTGIGAVLTVHFLRSGQAPKTSLTAEAERVAGLGKLFWYWCLDHGYWITERGMLAVVLGTTWEELDAFVGVAAAFVAQYAGLLAVEAAS